MATPVDTWPSALAQFVLVFGCLVPGAYFLGVQQHMALRGIWIAAFGYSCLAAVVMSAKFAGGSGSTISSLATAGAPVI
jgi:Na+-driven multidrug efflux pump